MHATNSLKLPRDFATVLQSDICSYFLWLRDLHPLSNKLAQLFTPVH